MIASLPSPQEQGTAPGNSVQAVFGEPITARVERFAKFPDFPYASRLTVPNREILPRGAVRGPIDNEILTHIYDRAYRAFGEGKEMSGIYQDPERDVFLQWVMSRDPEPDAAAGNGLPRSVDYRLVLDGVAGDESFRDWHFVTLHVIDGGNRVVAEYWNTDGTFNGKGTTSRAPLAETLDQLRKYEAGIPSEALVVNP